jgi:hypothetical protein
MKIYAKTLDKNDDKLNPDAIPVIRYTKLYFKQECKKYLVTKVIRHFVGFVSNNGDCEAITHSDIALEVPPKHLVLNKSFDEIIEVYKSYGWEHTLKVKTIV